MATAHFAQTVDPPPACHETNRAMAVGVAAARNSLGDAAVVNRSRIPRVVNTDPPLAAVGLTLEEAAASGRPVGPRLCDLSASPRAIAIGEPRGALKLVVDEDTGEILGGHMVGAEAPEVIAQVVLAMDAEIEFQRLSWIFDVQPSMSETIALAVRFGGA